MEDKTMMLFPQWKQAVQNFIDEGFKPGDVVTKRMVVRELWVGDSHPRDNHTEVSADSTDILNHD